MLTSEKPDQCNVLSEITTTTASVLSQLLSQAEKDRNVERICKAFIRLITAPESEEDFAEIPTSSESSTTRI